MYAVVCDGSEARTSQRLLRANTPNQQRVVYVLKKKIKLLGSFHYLKIVMLNRPPWNNTSVRII